MTNMTDKTAATAVPAVPETAQPAATEDAPQQPALPQLVVAPDAGPTVWLGGLGVRFLLDGGHTAGRFSVVEHPIRPRSLASPLHTHAEEDEYSFILEGQVGVQIGDQVFTAGPGAFVFKPRGVPHAFWNAGDEPARLLELISPAGFERYFAELAPLMPPAAAAPDLAGMAAVRERYHLAVDPTSIPALVQRHGLSAARSDAAR
jgi:quercetin dioxygenase-like cupin family protein